MTMSFQASNTAVCESTSQNGVQQPSSQSIRGTISVVSLSGEPFGVASRGSQGRHRRSACSGSSESEGCCGFVT